MALNNGYIKIHRQILNWEWYKSTETFALFLHLLLTANFTDGRFEGLTIRRGQLVTSLPSLAKGTGMSIQQVRTAIKHLISTGEITDESTNRYRIITVLKYSEYQDETDKSTVNQQTANRQPTDDQQATNRQSTGNQQQYKNDNNNKNGRMEEGNNGRGTGTASRFLPPTLDEVSAYCRERGNGIDAQHFIDYYEARGWELKPRQKMKDWKAAVRTWEQNEKKPAASPVPAKKVVAQQYTQRDYSQPADSSSYDDFMDRLDSLM